MAKFRHLMIEGPEQPDPYTYPGTVGSKEFDRPMRDRVPHADRLRQQLETAAAAAAEFVRSHGGRIELAGIPLEFESDPKFDLLLRSLENRQQGIELVNVRRDGNVTKATVFVPAGKLEHFLRRVEQYATEERESGKPKHADLIESIASIRLAVVQAYWTDPPSLFPQDEDTAVWWEVWLRGGEEGDQDARMAEFLALAGQSEIALDDRVVRFPERVVLLAFGTPRQWADSLPLLNLLAELRKVKEVPTDYLNLGGSDQAEFAIEAAGRVVPPDEGAPAVCLLDTGVNRQHPLLRMAIDPEDVLAADPEWAATDQDGHGTGMAGIALYGSDLAGFVSGAGTVTLSNRVESVKLLRKTVANDPKNYGNLTQLSVARAELRNPGRARTVCLAITALDPQDHGFPSAWSGAVDQHASGHLDSVRRLYVVSAGNILNLTVDSTYRYPHTNREQAGIRDPAQAWNAITVGAHTEKVTIFGAEFAGWQPLAGSGTLCPSSCTSMMWEEDGWPIKPDVVMEGGNYARRPDEQLDVCTDLGMLTTVVEPTGRLFETMCDTSAAAAQVARLATGVQAEYPGLWPETVRGLVIHSARWTPGMRAEFQGNRKATAQLLLRCYGYGVPDLDRALWTVRNRVSLVYQGEMQPFEREGSVTRTRDCHLHALPWPQDVLRGLGSETVQVHVTLSYFVEPSPGRVQWKSTHRYQSHGLRFKVKGATETLEEFRGRVTKDSWADDESPGGVREPQPWDLGPRLRTRGSIHSDWWRDTATAVADCGYVAVYPVTGWWRERKHLGRHDSTARYSLIVTLATRSEEADLYTPIANQVAVTTEA
ncbi:MAG: hypothetical protein JWO31_336 [Phycisphaerales bacterium]|nr:hypothetical protein [Phycisphaerales bacterium]